MEVMVGVEGVSSTVNPAESVSVPPGVVTETPLVPVVAAESIEILAVIRVELSSLKVFTVIPEPKLTTAVSVKSVPVIVTTSAAP
jgi:hypothetical protein